jgi:hypothetical protein
LQSGSSAGSSQRIKKKLCGFLVKMKKPQSLEIAVKKLSSLGSLDGIDFLFFGLHRGLDVGGHVAGTVFPFQGRIRCSRAVHAGGIFRHSLAPHAFLHDRQAVPFIVAAAGGCHEHTVFPFPHSCTDHDTHFLKIRLGLIFQSRKNRCVSHYSGRFQTVVFQWIPNPGMVNLISISQKQFECQSKTNGLFINSNGGIFFMGKKSGLVYNPEEQNN